MMDNDIEFYRDAVFEIILCNEHIPREVYELRYTLFLRAADFYFKKNTHCDVLEPFPSCFFDFDTKQRRYDELKQCITEMPKLSEINEATSLPELTWKLLHWIFTNPLKISVTKQSEISAYLTDQLQDDTKLMTIPYPSDYCKRFEIIHPREINSTKVFLKHKETFRSFFAYHGSPLHNFHSIIHRGLRCSLNIRTAYGPGTYLTSNLDTATSYAKQYGKGEQGISYCIAIVEVIKHPSINVFNFNAVSGRPAGKLENYNFDNVSSSDLMYYVVNSDDLMRLKHLLVFHY